MAAPLALELRARKPVTVAGEGIVLDLDHQIFADLQIRKGKSGLCDTDRAAVGGEVRLGRSRGGGGGGDS